MTPARRESFPTSRGSSSSRAGLLSATACPRGRCARPSAAGVWGGDAGPRGVADRSRRRSARRPVESSASPLLLAFTFSAASALSAGRFASSAGRLASSADRLTSSPGRLASSVGRLASPEGWSASSADRLTSLAGRFGASPRPLGRLVRSGLVALTAGSRALPLDRASGYAVGPAPGLPVRGQCPLGGCIRHDLARGLRRCGTRPRGLAPRGRVLQEELAAGGPVRVVGARARRGVADHQEARRRVSGALEEVAHHRRSWHGSYCPAWSPR